MRKKFAFRHFMVVHDTVYVHIGTFLDALAKLESPENKVLGSWSGPGAPEATVGGNSVTTSPTPVAALPGQKPYLDGTLFILSRDLFTVFTQYTFMIRAAVADTITETINMWLSPFKIERIQLAYAKFRIPQGSCPLDAAFLHPVSSLAMKEMDANLAVNRDDPPCSVFYPKQGMQQAVA